MAKLPFAAVLFSVAVLLAVRFYVSHVIAAQAPIIILVDVLIMMSSAVLAYGMLGMVQELNLVVLGFLLIAYGQLLVDWPPLLGMESIVGLIVEYVTFFAGTILLLYGITKFQEKYKFK